MIGMAVAAKAVERLIGLDGFPVNTERRAKLVKAFRNSDTEEIAHRAISTWVSDSSKCPGPSEIAAIISDLNLRHREQVGVARAQCVACGGSGWIEMRGLSRFDGTIVTGAKPCICRSIGQPVVADRDACSMCGGHGLYGGHIGTDHDGPWENCLCPEGKTEDAIQRRIEGNIAREKILAAGSKILAKFWRIKSSPPSTPESPMQRVSKILTGYDEDYHGEF